MPRDFRSEYEAVTKALDEKLQHIELRNREADFLREHGTKISPEFLAVLREEMQKPYGGQYSTTDRLALAHEFRDLRSGVEKLYRDQVPVLEGTKALLRDRLLLLEQAEVEIKIGAYLPEGEAQYLKNIPYGSRHTDAQRQLIKDEVLLAFGAEIDAIRQP